MKLSISRPAAFSAAFVAVATRLFLAFSVDVGPVNTGVLLSTLVGGALTAGWLFALNALRDRADLRGGRFLLPLSVILLFAIFVDGCVVLSAIARSAGYLSPEATPAFLFALPAGLTLFWCVSRNGDAVGNGATLWLWLFPALLLLVVLFQARHYRLEWLAPWLGNGPTEIAANGLAAAGWTIPASAILMLSDDAKADGEGSSRPFVLISLVAVVAALLLFLRLMMAPAPLGGNSWLQRLDALLTNGRAPLYLQLPMIVMWYAGLFHLLACEGFACAAILQRLTGRGDGRLYAATVAAGMGVCALTGIPEAARQAAWARGLFPMAAGMAALGLLGASHGKGGVRKCA